MMKTIDRLFGEGWPIWIVSIKGNNKEACTGFLINWENILTEATCLQGSKINEITSFVGRKDLKKDPIKEGSIELTCHSIAYDISSSLAILRMNHEVPMGYVPVEVDQSMDHTISITGTSLGWGINSKHGDRLTQLRSQEIECEGVMNFRGFCCENFDYVDPGSPLSIFSHHNTDLVVGIYVPDTVAPWKCKKGFQYYERISSKMDFIREVLMQSFDFQRQCNEKEECRLTQRGCECPDLSQKPHIAIELFVLSITTIFLCFIFISFACHRKRKKFGF